MLFSPPILLAMGWLQALIFLVFVVLWVLGQIADAKRKRALPKPDRKLIPPPRPADQADALREQVEEFLQQVDREPELVELEPEVGEVLADDERPAHESVAEHVVEHIGSASSSFKEQTSHLGEGFDHALGSLESRYVARMKKQEEQKAAQPDTPVEVLAELLASPQKVRQAIVLNEILRPPADRW